MLTDLLGFVLFFLICFALLGFNAVIFVYDIYFLCFPPVSNLFPLQLFAILPQLFWPSCLFLIHVFTVCLKQQ